MATYIPGVTDYIPQIQEFQPDFNFYAQSLQMSQGKYDANHDKLSNLYGSLLNSPMLREKNIEERDAFFKTIDQDIQRMSGMDLSKQQNADSASAIFNQMLDNDEIVKDMVWTKNWQKEHQRADGFRNCIDPAKCGGSWWEEGVTALNYKADEFKNATDAEAMNFSNAKFTPYQDVMGKAVKMAKEADLNVTIDQKTGGYIVTTKNGPNLLAKPLAQLFMGTLGKDPAVMEYYKTKAYVARKNWIENKIPELGSREAAQQAYINEMTQTTEPALKKAQQEAQYAQENISNQRKGLENEIKTKGTTQGSALAEIYQEMLGTEEQVNATNEVLTDANGNMKVGLNNGQTLAALDNLDAANAAHYLEGDIGNAAMVLSNKDYSQTMEVDPYAMENVRHSNRISLMGMQYKKDIALLDHKFNLDVLEKKMEARGDATANEGWAVDITAGGVAVAYDKNGDIDESATYNNFKAAEDLSKAELSGNEREMLTEAFGTLQEEARITDPTKSAGARADLIAMTEGLISTSKDDKLLKKFQGMSPEAKLKFIQKYDYVGNVHKMSGPIADQLYSDVLYPMMDMTKKNNTVTRKYFDKLWSSDENKTRRTAIKRKQSVLDQLDNGYRKNVTKVKADIQSQGSKYGDWAPAINAFIDENGIQREEKDFINTYMKDAVANTSDVMYRRLVDGKLVPNRNTAENQDGKMVILPTDPEPVRVDKRVVARAAYDEAKEMYANMDEDDQLMQKWREAYSEFSVALGQTSVTGGGSQAVEKGRGYQADPVEFQSTASTGFMGTARDVFSAGNNGRVVMGGVGAIPEGSSENAQAILRQIYSDYASRGNPKDKSRPILDITTQAIAGGNRDWMAVNIKVDDAYASQYTGSKSNKGLLYDNRLDLQKEGITMYLKKEAATNQFYQNSKWDDIATVMHYNGKYDIDDYPGIFDGELTNIDGGILLQGTLQNMDAKGVVTPETITQPYWGNDVDPAYIMNDFREKYLKPAVNGIKQDQAAYNLTQIKNPAQL